MSDHNYILCRFFLAATSQEIAVCHALAIPREGDVFDCDGWRDNAGPEAPYHLRVVRVERRACYDGLEFSYDEREIPCLQEDCIHVYVERQDPPP